MAMLLMVGGGSWLQAKKIHHNSLWKKPNRKKKAKQASQVTF